MPVDRRLTTRMTASVSPAMPMLDMEPRSRTPAPPIAQVKATGSRDRPITVMIEPVTTGGKNRTRWAKNVDTTSPIRPAAMTAPNTGRRPPSSAMATIVETLANEMPCTIGQPGAERPQAQGLQNVANPLTKMPAVTRSAMSVGDSPAAPPRISGGAMTPPYIVRMCCAP